MSRILIAEDEPRMRSFLEKGLRSAGYTPTGCGDGAAAAALARDEDFDLVILDLGLPRQDGFSVLRAIRARGVRLPVLVLTGRDRVEDTISALESGADDYLTKPFAFSELLARVRARTRTFAAGAARDTVTAGDVALDLREWRATVAGREVPLTRREFRLLETFARHPGQALTRDDLVAHVWGHQADLASNTVDVHVGHLRRKLGAGRLETVRGYGYRMTGSA